MADGHLAIGELGRRTGTKVETIRYYERIGLLAAPLAHKPRTIAPTAPSIWAA